VAGLAAVKGSHTEETKKPTRNVIKNVGRKKNQIGIKRARVKTTGKEEIKGALGHGKRHVGGEGGAGCQVLRVCYRDNTHNKKEKSHARIERGCTV